MEKEYYKNNFNASIVKCCASRAHKQFDKGNMRICTAGEGIVSSHSLCGGWELSKKFEKAGKGGGHVKRWHYLSYVLNYPQPEDPRYHVKLSDIRSEYEEKFGSVYLDLHNF